MVKSASGMSKVTVVPRRGFCAANSNVALGSMNFLISHAEAQRSISGLGRVQTSRRQTTEIMHQIVVVVLGNVD